MNSLSVRLIHTCTNVFMADTHIMLISNTMCCMHSSQFTTIFVYSVILLNVPHYLRCNLSYRNTDA